MGQAGSVRNGGEVIVEYLVREKVPYVFGLCGHGNVRLLDALYDRTDAIRTISTRHEQTAGHMADAFFRGRTPPGRHAHLVRAGIGEHSHQHRGRPDRGSGISGTRGIQTFGTRTVGKIEEIRTRDQPRGKLIWPCLGPHRPGRASKTCPGQELHSACHD
jgi:Thiamine pyrophosphate enzyme, N-terminal TPP binding domain